MALNTKPKGQQPRPPLTEAEEEARFERAISGAPDYKPPGGGSPTKRERKTPTTVTLAQEQLDDLTEIARERGMSRAAVMISSFADTISAWKKSKL